MQVENQDVNSDKAQPIAGKRKIYVASSWRCALQPETVRQLREAGHEVYDFRAPHFGKRGTGFSWAEIDPEWQKWSAATFREALSNPIATHGLAADLAGLWWSDTLVLVQPCGRSSHLELGWAIGSGRRVAVLLAEGQEPELMLGLAHKLALDMPELLAWLGATP